MKTTQIVSHRQTSWRSQTSIQAKPNLISVKDYNRVEALKRGYGDIETEALADFVLYATEFLSKPHVEVGRTGPVCPFVPKAIESGRLVMTTSNATCAEDAQNEIAGLRDVLLQMEPQSEVGTRADREQLLKSIIVVFPFLGANDFSVIDDIQAEFKTKFIKSGLMIGQFHPNCEEPGLHNADFRPLQAPIPCLAIRHITVFDAPFMMSCFEHMEAFVSIFANDGRARLNKFIN